MNTPKRTIALIAAITLVALVAPLTVAELPSRTVLRRTPRPSVMTPTATSVNPLTGVLVTDIDPARVAATGRVSLHPSWNGPFRAHQTLAVWVVTLLDRRALGSGSLDVITRFILPDGSLYQMVTTPVDPDALPGAMADRAEISPFPVPVVRPQPFNLFGPRRGVQGINLDPQGLRETTFTSVMLPVSGTWITRHNLYGDWTVEVRLVRNGRQLGQASRVFYIGL